MSGAYREVPACDHGVEFDVAEARAMEATPPPPELDAFRREVWRAKSISQIRKRWPRLDGACPLGCGYFGIAYASTEHYVLGDW